MAKCPGADDVRRRAARSGLLLLAMLASVAPCSALDPEFDLESVRRIVAHTPLLPRTTPADIEKLLDGAAFRETRRLGEGDANWNPLHPAWKSLYDRVRADLESERAAIVSAAAADRPRLEALEHEQLLKLAAALPAADVRTILTYYDSPQGLRYQAFMQRIDAVAAGGVASSFGLATSPKDPATQKADAAKSQRYAEMLAMSDTFQATLAGVNASSAGHPDPSGAAVFGIFAAAAIASHRAELETLHSEYQADLPDFVAFQKTPAAQRLFQAMGRIAIDSVPQMSEKPPPDLFAAARSKYGEQWRAAYAARASGHR